MDFAGYNIEFDEEKQRKLEEGTKEVLSYLVWATEKHLRLEWMI